MDYKDSKIIKSTDFWYEGRKGLMKILMSKVLKKGRRLKILDVGAGVGDDLHVLNKYGDIYAIDINKRALDLIPANMCKEKRKANACDMPYEDDFFDVVLCFDVLEHISNDKKAVSEIYRVLKKDGSLFFAMPSFNFLFSSHDKAIGHKRRYNKKTLKKLLKNFRCLKLYYWNFFLFLPVALMRLMKKHSKPKLDYIELPGGINKLFYSFLIVENRLIKYSVPLPFGLSIVGFCSK